MRPAGSGASRADNDDMTMDAARAMDTFAVGDSAALGLSATGIMASLITGLHHYADRHGIDFASVLAASDATYASQAARGHHHDVGQEVRVRASAVLTRHENGLPATGVITAVLGEGDTRTYRIISPWRPDAVVLTAAELEPVPALRPLMTSIGLVSSLDHAEEALITVCALIDERRAAALPTDWAYIRDRGTLVGVISAMHGIREVTVLDELAPQITARAGELRAGAAPREPGTLDRRTSPAPDGDSPARLATRGFPRWPAAAPPSRAAPIDHPTSTTHPRHTSRARARVSSEKAAMEKEVPHASGSTQRPGHRGNPLEQGADSVEVNSAGQPQDWRTG